DGVSVGSTIITGPTTSPGASAETQLSSLAAPSSSSAAASAFFCTRCDDDPALSSAGRLRFFGFLSPLNVSGLTIVKKKGTRKRNTMPGGGTVCVGKGSRFRLSVRNAATSTDVGASLGVKD